MRIGNIVAAAGLAAFVAGCGSDSSCKDESPPLADTSPVTICSTVPPSQPVTVKVKACPRCDQSTPTCLVHTDQIARGLVTIEPVAEVCDADASCPVGGNCAVPELSCTFNVPAMANGETLTVNVIAPGGGITETITVQTAAPVCSG